ERGINSIIVVSSPFHMKRALQMYRDAGFTAYGSPAPDDPLQAEPTSRVRYTLRECVLLARYLLFGT
ncbi:MAG: ElyC/SanA/YdcF family protein, partial [Chloroflexota bacterium]|nr:ElyC/SanA/YdcF family protein [Chloroflexota bacterium]